jgi:tetratricopeptide (TPR) repeat protein
MRRATIAGARAIYEAIVGPNHPDPARVRQQLAMLDMAEGRLNQAQATLAEVAAIQRRRLHLPHPDLARTLMAQGHLSEIQGRLQQARMCYAEALEQLERVLPSHPITARCRGSLAALAAPTDAAIAPDERRGSSNQRNSLQVE